jgi:hypothetical protein
MSVLYLFSSVKLKLIQIFKNSFLTSKYMKCISIANINWLVLFREIIAIYSENHTKPIYTLCGQNAELLILKVGGTYSYHWALKVQGSHNVQNLNGYL